MTRHNPRSNSEAVARETRKGFSLIEAAIVLGVVGLVIGGIWYAASALSYQYNKQQLFKGFLTLQNNVDKYLTQAQPCINDVYLYNTVFYPAGFHGLFYPEEWENGNFSAFLSNRPGSIEIRCDEDGTKFVQLQLLYFKNQTICMEFADFLSRNKMNIIYNGCWAWISGSANLRVRMEINRRN